MVEVTTIASTAVDGVNLYLQAQEYFPYIKSAFYIGVVTATGYVIYKITAPSVRKMMWKPNHMALKGKVAIVTGASRGVGKGIALGLAEAGATVYITGRTENTIQGSNMGSINETALQCNGFGGKGIPIVCDHGKDADIAAVFERVISEQGKIDILVNNVTQIPAQIKPPYNEKIHFWEAGTKLWDPIINVGLRSHYVAACHAAQLMTKQKNGVIINVSSEGAQNYLFFLAYGVGKCALDRMTKDMAHELKDFNVAAISIWPGLVKTEKNMEYSDYIRDMWKVDVEDKGETPMYSGRVVAALCSDSKIMKKSGKSFTNSKVASDYGVTDIDGRQPYAPGTFSFYLDHLTSVTKKRIFGH